MKSNPNFDIKNHKLENFLTIFNTVINQTKKDGNTFNQDSYTEDGIKDILLTVGEKIYKFLQQIIDSLDLPDIIKKALITLKAIVSLVHAIKNHDQN